MKGFFLGLLFLCATCFSALAAEKALLIDSAGHNLGTASNPIYVSGGANTTENAVPASTGTALVDSGIYALNGMVGIGTTVPQSRLMVDGGVYPAADNVYDLGSDSYSWKDLHVDGTIYSGQAAISGTGVSRFTGNLVAIGTTTAAGYADTAGDLYVQNDLEVDGKAYIDSSIYLPSLTANYVPYIQNSSGLLTDSYIYQTTGGDVALFMNNTIGDASNGKSFYIYRKASEGTSSIRLFVDQYKTPQIQFTDTGYISSITYAGKLYFYAGDTGDFTFNPNQIDSDFKVEGDLRRLIGADAGTNNVGIGTSSNPGAQLYVGGAGTAASKTSIDGNGDLLVKDSIEVDGNIYVDTGIYLTHTTAAALYIRQPDGGCSKCEVDTAGTTWSCADITCGPGM